MAIGKTHLAVGKTVQVALAVDTARLNETVLCSPPMGAAVHAQRAANRAGNAAQKCKPGNTSSLCRARDHHIKHCGSDCKTLAVDLYAVETPAQPDDDAGNAAVADDQIGAGADHSHRNVARQVAHEISEVVFVFRHEKNLRRTTNTKPGELTERLIGQQAPAQFGHPRFQVWDNVREGHDLSSPGLSR